MSVFPVSEDEQTDGQKTQQVGGGRYHYIEYIYFNKYSKTDRKECNNIDNTWD